MDSGMLQDFWTWDAGSEGSYMFIPKNPVSKPCVQLPTYEPWGIREPEKPQAPVLFNAHTSGPHLWHSYLYKDQSNHRPNLHDPLVHEHGYGIYGPS